MEFLKKIRSAIRRLSNQSLYKLPLIIFLASAVTLTPFLIKSQRSGIPTDPSTGGNLSSYDISVPVTAPAFVIEVSEVSLNDEPFSESSCPASVVSVQSAMSEIVEPESRVSIVSEEVILDPVHSKDELRRTAEYFMKRKTELENSLVTQQFFSKTILLDNLIGTYAFVYAKDENYANNLNGFFYYLIDQSASTSSLSPVVLSISTLFDEPDRQAVIADESYADPDILDTLRKSLQTFLGELYDDAVLDFIYQNYRKLFSVRLAGGNVPICFYKLELPGLDVYFRNAFMTYIEFYVK